MLIPPIALQSVVSTTGEIQKQAQANSVKEDVLSKLYTPLVLPTPESIEKIDKQGSSTEKEDGGGNALNISLQSSPEQNSASTTTNEPQEVDYGLSNSTLTGIIINKKI